MDESPAERQPEASTGRAAKRCGNFTLAAEPYAQFMAREQDIGELDLDRPPSNGSVCLRLCTCECCWTRSSRMDYVLEVLSPTLYSAAGMREGGNFRRSRIDTAKQVPAGPDAEKGVQVEDVVVPAVLQAPEAGKDGVTVRMVWPAGLPLDAPMPVVVYLHGGGWCLSHPQEATYTGLGKSLCMRLKAIVVMPDYRLAPEYPFPGGVFDAYDSLRWLGSTGGAAWFAERGLTPRLSQVGLCGESAGANFALVLATLMRDELQADLSPAPPEITAMRNVWVAPLMPALVLDKTTASMLSNRKVGPLTSSLMRWFVQQLIQGDPGLLYDRRVCPLQAGVHDLPHVTLLSAGKDVLADDARVLEAALRAEGGSFTHQHNAGEGHASFITSPSKQAALLEMLASGWALATTVRQRRAMTSNHVSFTLAGVVVALSHVKL